MVVVFIVLFLLLTFWYSLLPPPHPIFPTPKVSLRMLQKVGYWSKNRNGGQGAGRDAAGRGGGRGHLGRKEPCIVELGLGGAVRQGR